jgi:hypothetical protein
MVHYDHGMLGATLALAVGAQRRHGWPIVVLAALAGMFPDWDAMSKHISPETYRLGHRVWGHNVFAVSLAGLALGIMGYLIHRSSTRQPAESDRAGDMGYWIMLALLIMLTHPLMDLLYCGLDRGADWPVALFWPLVSDRFGQPWIPWHDWGATGILVAGLLLIGLLPRYSQRWACISVGMLTVYVGARGAFF